MSTLRLLSLSTASETGGGVRGSGWSSSKSRDAADSDCLSTLLASGLRGIITRSERAKDDIKAVF